MTRPGPMRGAATSVVATLAGSASAVGEALAGLPPAVRCVEVRADLCGDIDPQSLRRHFDGDLLYTLRSIADGGRCADPEHRRRERLCAAADCYDLVDLEVDRDLDATLLDRIAPPRRVLSWHGPATDLEGLCRRFGQMAATEARLYRLAPAASTLGEALVPLRLLSTIGRGDVTAYARGPAGMWTRVLAPRFGTPVAFATLDLPADAGGPVGGLPGGGSPVGGPPDGELPVARLLAHYPLQALSGVEEVYGIIGASVAKSLTPLVNNTAYRSLGLPALFLPFPTGELPQSLAELRTGLDELDLPLKGATVTSPHKEAALSLAAEATPLARRAGAASLVVRRAEGWWVDTEAAGVVATLAGRGVEVAGRRAAVIGCGGGG
ncbi:MAG: type I 3-dehydroquinate dehydratase, partial [Carbonactinosporaceae bacterium]